MDNSAMILAFADAAIAYERTLPKLGHFIEAWHLGDLMLPGSDEETYAELYRREAAHCEEIYSLSGYEALLHIRFSDDEAYAAKCAFSLDLEEILEIEQHINDIVTKIINRHTGRP